MSNLRLCVKNAADFAAVTADPAASSSLPVTNLQLASRGRVWRSSSDADQAIYLTWNGTGYYLNFLSLWRHNLESGATWRVQIYSDAAWTTQVYDSGAVDACDYATLGELDFGVDPLGSSVFDGFLGQMYSLIYFTRVLALSVKITLSNTGNSAGFLQASYLYARDYTEMTYNADAAGLGWRDDTEQFRTDGGNLRGSGSVAWREASINLSVISSAQRPTVMDMLRYAGKQKPIFAAIFPESAGELERDYTQIGKLIDLPFLDTDGGHYNLWSTQLRIGEI